MPANHISLNDLRNKVISEAIKCHRVHDQFNTLLDKLRKNCPHEEVVETPRRNDDGTRNELPQRICICCALEEQASSFSGMSDGFNKLEKSKVVKEVSPKEFSKYRELRPLKKTRELQPA